MKKTIKLVLFLAIVAGLCGGALSAVYNATDPIIQEAAIASERENLVKIYPGEEFRTFDTGLVDYPEIQGCYESSKGYVYKCAVNGYGGTVVFLVALDNDGTYSGFEVIDASSETKGFGSQVADEPFKKGIVDKNIGDSIDLISGSTVSSKAVSTGIDAAADHYENYVK